MKNWGIASAALAASMLVPAAGVAAPPAADADGSFYVQCDGAPNNMTAGESAARLVGAVTLLGLFAPAHESFDASKRKFGTDGVTACSMLIEGEHKEGNPERRQGLILARALHRIEAKDYDGVSADVALARQEADTAGLMNDPYFRQAYAASYDRIDAAALVRGGHPDQAETAALRDLPAYQNSTLEMLAMRDPAQWTRAPDDAELAFLAAMTKLFPPTALAWAGRLEEAGRFAEAAKLRDAWADYDASLARGLGGSQPMITAAIDHALAGDHDAAAALAAAAQANFDTRRSQGKPDTSPEAVVELIDFYGIVAAMQGGDLPVARQRFAARSQWLAPPLGAVMAVSERLRAGAASDALAGGLAKNSDALWQAHADLAAATRLTSDKDNKTLFLMMPHASKASAYAAVSKKVWRTDKSAIVVKMKPKPGEPEAKAPSDLLLLIGVDPSVALDAYRLHAALLAKSRGQHGYVVMPLAVKGAIFGMAVTGNRGDPGLPDPLFNDAEATIAALSARFPPPEAKP